jgi:hypothetical protein
VPTVETAAVTASEPPPVLPPPPAPPMSDYNLRPLQPVARLSAAVDPPLERVKLEVSAGAGKPEAPAREKEALPSVESLRSALQKRSQEAEALLETSDRPEREKMLALLRLMSGISEKELAKLPPEEVASALEQLRRLAQQLRLRAPLSLEKLYFCRSIESFGQYERLPDIPTFQAGVDGQPGEHVQVYVEVRNFGTVQRQDHYETRLSSSLEILEVVDKQRRKVVTMNPRACIDRSQTPRQDFFLNVQFHIPARLPPGLYTLWVTVKDMTPPAPGQDADARKARKSLDFRVCPPGTRKASQ